MMKILMMTFMAVVVGVTLAERPSSGEGYLTTPRSAAEIFAGKCASCHGKDGRAKTFKAKFNHARDLTNRAWQDDVSDERIFNSINNGKGKNMPAFGKKYSPAEIDALVAYVRTFKK